MSKPSWPASGEPGRPARYVTRRAVLGGAAAIAGARTAGAAATALPGSPTILVAGPPGSRVDQWAALIAEPLGKSLLQTEAVGRENIGGPDGVTGANHFQASTIPDGATAMMMPGTAALSWLVGDTRVRFDAGTWAPLWGASVSTVALSRAPLMRGRRVRVAVQTIVGPELAALLALDLMGIDAVPVPIGPGTPMSLDRADIDLVLVRGSSLKPEATRRWTHAFGLGMISANGRLARDPAFMDVPTVYELIEHGQSERANELSAALRSVTAAATLDAALVLPLLAPAAIVAWWRQGCTTLASAPDIQDQAARSFVRPVEGASVAASMAAITADSGTLLELRRWLAERHQWRPG